MIIAVDTSRAMKSYCRDTTYRISLRTQHMADTEHIKIFQQGAPVWNEWRNSNHTTRPDLSGADLSRIKRGFTDDFWSGAAWNLSNALLDMADMRDMVFSSGTDFSNACLAKSNLSGAQLHGCLFYSANLSYANLTGATLNQAILIGANLTGATLCNANMIGADISAADLRYTHILDSALGSVDVTEASALLGELPEGSLAKQTLREQTLHTRVWSGPTLPVPPFRIAASMVLPHGELTWMALYKKILSLLNQASQ